LYYSEEITQVMIFRRIITHLKLNKTLYKVKTLDLKK